MRHAKATKTSWEKDSSWYKDRTKGSGHYFHEHVVIPGAKRLLSLAPHSSLLDVGCGSGVLGRAIPKETAYVGIDVSPSLIEQAGREDPSHHQYKVLDATRSYLSGQTFTHAACILSLQNMDNQELAIKHAADHLVEYGVLVIVLNHPCFRIPRQSSWGIDPKNKMQYRIINRYLSPLEIPITMHPGKKQSTVTWSYHLPLSDYAAHLQANGLVIETIEEWSSDKKSVGRTAKMENRTRAEIPLFLAIKAVKFSPPSPPPRQDNP